MRFTSIALLFDESDPVVIHLGSTIHTSPDMYHVRALQSDRLTSPDRNDSLSSGNDGGTVEFASECLLEDDRRWSQIYRELFLVEISFSVPKGSAKTKLSASSMTVDVRTRTSRLITPIRSKNNSSQHQSQDNNNDSSQHEKIIISSLIDLASCLLVSSDRGSAGLKWDENGELLLSCGLLDL